MPAVRQRALSGALRLRQDTRSRTSNARNRRQSIAQSIPLHHLVCLSLEVMRPQSSRTTRHAMPCLCAHALLRSNSHLADHEPGPECNENGRRVGSGICSDDWLMYAAILEPVMTQPCLDRNDHVSYASAVALTSQPSAHNLLVRAQSENEKPDSQMKPRLTRHPSGAYIPYERK